MPEKQKSEKAIATRNQEAYRYPYEDRRRLRIYLVAGLGLLGALATMILHIYWYGAYKAPQMRLVAIAALIITVVYGSVLFLANQKRNNQAAILVLSALAAHLISYELFIRVPGIPAIQGGIALIFLTIIILPRRWYYGLVVAAIYGISSWAIGNFELFSRLDSTKFANLGDIFPILLGIMAVFLVMEGILNSNPVRNSIRNRMFLAFFFIVLSGMAILTTISLIIQVQESRTNAYQRLETVAFLRQQQAISWLNELKVTLTTINASNEFNTLAQKIISEGVLLESDTTLSPDQNVLQQQFNTIINESSIFDDLFIVDLDGDLFLSTDLEPSNQQVIQRDFSLYKYALQGMFVSPAFIDYSQGASPRVIVIVGLPILSTNGRPVGILAGRANMLGLELINQNLTGLGETGETYLVGSNRTMLSPSRFEEFRNLQGQSIDSRGIIAAQTSLSGRGEYTNYHGAEVFGVFTRIPEINASIIVEQTQDEALAASVAIIRTNVLAALGGLAMVLIVSLLITRSIALPIRSLVGAAQQVTNGELDVRAKVTIRDEVGILAETFNSMTDQFQSLVQNLELRVAERTAELEKRASQIQAAGQISRDIAYEINLEQVMNRAVNLIRDRFGFYHASIFLADEAREYAVLRASTGEPGRIMIERNHRLRIGQTGIVGYVVDTGKPRIAMDVGIDTSHLKNPLLPDTHSEMALPLMVGEEVIGALDVQSTSNDAFNQEDVSIIQTIADQIAVAISKANVLEDLRRSLAELERASQQSTLKGWREFLDRSHKAYGVRYARATLDTDIKPDQITMNAIQHNQTSILEPTDLQVGSEDQKVRILLVPIHSRGVNLGVIQMKLDAEMISSETTAFVESISERLGLALESARLLEEIQRRSLREQYISSITNKVRTTTNVDTILQTAVQELGRVLGVSEALIQLTPRAVQGN